MSRRNQDMDWGDDIRVERRTYWDRVALLVVLLIIIGVAIWWLESRFGANWAAGAVGVLAGVIVFAWGGGFAWAIMRGTLHSSAQFNADLAGVEMRRQAVMAERAKLDLVQAKAALQYQQDYDKDVRRLADQRARLLADVPQQQAPQFRAYGQEPQQIDGEWQEYD